MDFPRRRRALAPVVLASAASLVLLSACSPQAQQDDVTEINVVLANHPYTTLLQSMVGEYEAESGVTVNIASYGEDQLSDQYNVKLNSGATDIDVMMYRPPQEMRLWEQNGWIAPLTDYIENDADWDWEDFQESPRNSVSLDGEIYSVPILTEREVVYYRTDLFEAAGLSAPTTMDELRAAAEKLNDPANGVYGFVARGARSAAVTQFSSYLYSFGGDFHDGDTATIDTPEARAAYEFYTGMLRDFGPPGVTNMSWPEAVALFAQGKAAIYTDSDGMYLNFLDASKSTVVDTVGYAQFPAGPAGARSYYASSWGLAVNSASLKKDAAWDFIRWATSKETMLALQLEGQPGARTSSWEQGISGFPAALAEVILASEANSVPYDKPQIIEVARAREMIGGPIVAGIVGEDLDAAIEQAQRDYQALLDDQR